MTTGHNSNEQLKSIIERVERLEGEKKVLSEDIKQIYDEAKGGGFDAKALREIVRIRRRDVEKRKEHEAILETYLNALGMLGDLPLGRAAIDRLSA